MDESDTITGLIGQVQSAAAQESRTSLGRVIEALGRDSFIPNLMIPALAVVSPLSGVPLFSSLCGLTIALVAAQMLTQRRRIWLPGWLLAKQIDSARLSGAVQRMRRPAGWLDQISRPRFGLLVRPPFLWLTQALCLICGLMMPFLELVPFTSSILGGVVCLLSFGMLARDGLFTLLGVLTICGLGATVLTLVNGATA